MVLSVGGSVLSRVRLQAGLSTLGQIAVRCIAASFTLAFAVLLGRIYGAEYSGEFFFFMGTVAVLGGFTRLGVEQHLTAIVAPRASEPRRNTYSHFIACQIAVGCIVTLLGLLMLLVWVLTTGSIGSEFWSAKFLSAIIAATLGLNSSFIVASWFRATNRPSWSIWFESGIVYAGLLLVVLAFWASDSRPTVEVLGWSLGLLAFFTFAISSFVLYSIRSRVLLRTVRDSGRGLFSFGGLIVSNTTAMWLPVLALGALGQFAEVGVYSAAWRIAMFVGAFGVIVKSIVIRASIESKVDFAARYQVFSRLILDMAYVVVPFLVIGLGLIWQDGAVSKVFGAEFSELGSVLPILLLAQSVNVAGYLVETIVVIENQRSILNISAAVSVVISIVLVPLLAAGYGLVGASSGYFVSILVNRGVMIAMYQRRNMRRTGSKLAIG